MNLPTVDDLFSTQEERDNENREYVKAIPLDQICDFPNHPFKVRMDEKMLEMIAGFSEGDARKAFNLLEMVVSNGQIEGDKTTVTIDVLKRCLGILGGCE